MLNLITALSLLASIDIFQGNSIADQINIKANLLIRNKQPLAACEIIIANLKLNRNICTENYQDNELSQKLLQGNTQFKILHLLGISLTQLGQYNQAKLILNYAQQIAPAIQKNEIELSIANLDEAFYEKNLDQFLNTDDAIVKVTSREITIDSAKNSLKRYFLLGQVDNSLSRIKSKVNWLMLLSKLDKRISELRLIQDSELHKAPIVINEINEYLKHEPQDNLQTRIKFTSVLFQLSNLDLSWLENAQKQSLYTLSLVEKKGNGRELSTILGLRGKILLIQGNVTEAQSSFVKAVNIANLSHAPDREHPSFALSINT